MSTQPIAQTPIIESKPIIAQDGDDLTFPPLFTSVQRYITPNHKTRARRAIVELIQSALGTICVGAYGFTDPEIIQALIERSQRGVIVRLLLDHTQASGPAERKQLDLLFKAGFVLGDHPTQSCLLIGTSECHGQIRHYKNIIVDAVALEHGSLNYSESGFFQDNTVTIESDRALAAWYLDQWEAAWKWVAANDARYNAPAAAPEGKS